MKLILFAVTLLTSLSFYKKTNITTQKSDTLHYKKAEKYTDTTSYMRECFNKMIPNCNEKLKIIEKELIENKILENNTSEAFRKIYLIYIKNLNLDDNKNTPSYFRKQYKISEIVRKNLSIPEKNLETPPECYTKIKQDPNLKNISYFKFMDKNNELDNIFISGETPKSWNKFDSLEEALSYHFNDEYFKSRDVKSMILLFLYHHYHLYTIENMNQDLRIHR